MLLLFFYRLLYPLLLAAGFVAQLFHPKIREGLSLRRAGKTPPWLNFPEKTRPIWIHCSSGEFEYAKPLIRNIKQKHPNQKILVTYFSPSVAKSVAGTLGVDFACPSPWDLPGSLTKFIEHHQPKALLVARTDLWPEMLQSCAKNKIPRLLFSKTLGPNPSLWSQWTLKKLTDIFVVNEEARKRLAFLLGGSVGVHNAGDTRYDQVMYRLSNGRPLKPLYNFNKPLLIAGSTWPSDESLLVPFISNHRNDLGLVIAPHEPSAAHLKGLIAKLKQQGLDYQLYSESNDWDPACVLIIDQVGILADLYAWGCWAYVGGGLDRQVHSVMEPLAAGLMTFIGPRHQKNQEAMDFKNNAVDGVPPVQVVKTASDLLTRFEGQGHQWQESHHRNLKLLIHARQGASLRVLRWLDDHIDWT